MMKEMPLVRHFVACRSIGTNPDGTGVILHDPAYRVAKSSEGRIWFYVSLTNGRGEHAFSVEFARFDRGTERVVFRTSPVPRDLGADPVEVYSFPITVSWVPLRYSGQYSFHLLCDGHRIAEEQIVVV